MPCRHVFPVAFALAMAACSQDEAPVAVVDPFTVAGLPVTVDTATGGFAIGPFRGFTGGGGAYAAPFAARKSDATVVFAFGAYSFEEEAGGWAPISVASRTADGLSLADGSTAKLTVVSEGVVALDLLAPAGTNRVSAAFACDPAERFLGFGGQSDALEHRGHHVPIWVSEQGAGKSDNIGDEQLSFVGRPHDAYFPVPFFVSPLGHGVLVEGTERMVFELCSERDDAWRVEVWSNRLRLVFFVGEGPLQVVERATGYFGRPPMPPDWALFPWLGLKGGTEAVRTRAKAARQAQIPASAVWSEDWLGEVISPLAGHNIKYHWQWDPTHYPDLPGLIGELHAMDLRFMAYFNPFVLKGYPEWDEAVAGGFLPKTPDGADYTFAVPMGDGSVVDLTNPKAREWTLGYMQAGRKLGLDGWMADFAEWVPFDARFADGRTGAEVSSDYPRLWQSLNRDACSDDCVFFVRSGFTGSSALATAAWGGDQNTDFGEDDGLPTAVRIGVGLGLAGVSFYGSDIAGYTSIATPPSTRELFFRWTEAGALEPIMRTHEGMAGPDNWQFDEDAETLEHFRRYATLHASLFPVWKALLAQAHETGRPVIRHPALHYPGDPALLAVRDTYLVGDALYVAPVVTAGALDRTLALPPGRWADWWTGERHDGPASLTVPAPVGELPLFVREGAVLPLLVEGVTSPAEAVASMDDTLVVRLVLGRDGEFTMADGTHLALTSSSATDPGDLGLPACSGDARPCTDKTGRLRRARLDGPSLAADGFAFTATGGPPGRRYDLTLVTE